MTVLPLLFAVCASGANFAQVKYELFGAFGPESSVRISEPGAPGFKDYPAKITMNTWVTYLVQFELEGEKIQFEMSNFQSPSLVEVKGGKIPMLACELLGVNK